MTQSSFGRVTAVPGHRQEHIFRQLPFAFPPTPSPNSPPEAAAQVLPSSVVLKVNRRHGHVNLAITMPPQQANAAGDRAGWCWGGAGVGVGGGRVRGAGVVGRCLWWLSEMGPGERCAMGGGWQQADAGQDGLCGNFNSVAGDDTVKLWTERFDPMVWRGTSLFN